MAWQPLSTAPANTPVLLRYQKNGKSYRTRVSGVKIVTQATMKPLYKHEHDGRFDPQNIDRVSYETSDTSPYEGYTVSASPYVMWVDALERLICDTSSKKSVSIPVEWHPIPE